MRDGLRVTPGSRVLIVGAGGPVGLAAIQIARLHGATVDAVSGEAAMEQCAAGHDSDDLSWLATRIANGDLTPVVGRRYGLGEIRRAHAELGQGATCGARIICHEEC